MSFVTTFNSLSTNGWSAKGSGGYSPIYVLANTNVGTDVAISENGNYVIASNAIANTAGIVKVYTVNNNVLINQAKTRPIIEYPTAFFLYNYGCYSYPSENCFFVY